MFKTNEKVHLYKRIDTNIVYNYYNLIYFLYNYMYYLDEKCVPRSSVILQHCILQSINSTAVRANQVI